ncbi:CBU_0592 family membrane protein [Nocardia pseudovaccinii]|uniref:CBU_0592 family membrane protein n=1 Tax=Nocardia pseudovaccinii TaxID=189540 RepID=UPI003D902B92
MNQALQIAGALLLLGAFIAAQVGATRDTSFRYLVANTTGSAVLAALAFRDGGWGFFLLEGTWSAVSLVSLYRVSHGTQGGGRRTKPPEPRDVRMRGDELTRPDRIIHMFRDSYACSQGRQWLQPHVLWWMFTYLRDNRIRIDLAVLTAPELTRRAAEMALPTDHQQPVAHTNHANMNLRLWWSIMADIARLVSVPRWRRLLDGTALPDVRELEQRADALGLRLWMSSTTVEELAGIAQSLAVVAEHERAGSVTADEIMARVLLPELLLAEMYWLHTLHGQPSSGNRPTREIMLLHRCAEARIRWADGHYLDPLDQLYLCAGELLDRLTQLPDNEQDATTRRITSLYTQLRAADNETSATPSESEHRAITDIG